MIPLTKTIMPPPVALAEDNRQKAMISADVRALSMLLHDDVIYIHSQGHRDTKRTFLDTIGVGLVSYETMDLDVHSTMALGADAWLICGRLQANAHVRDNLVKIDAIFTATWLAKDGAWQMTSWQSTPWPG